MKNFDTLQKGHQFGLKYLDSRYFTKKRKEKETAAMCNIREHRSIIEYKDSQMSKYYHDV